eukprot:Nk52_evm38s2367 gene=Nk52_evmTU38s2367
MPRRRRETRKRDRSEPALYPDGRDASVKTDEVSVAIEEDSKERRFSSLASEMAHCIALEDGGGSVDSNLQLKGVEQKLESLNASIRSLNDTGSNGDKNADAEGADEDSESLKLTLNDIKRNQMVYESVNVLEDTHYLGAHRDSICDSNLDNSLQQSFQVHIRQDSLANSSVGNDSFGLLPTVQGPFVRTMGSDSDANIGAVTENCVEECKGGGSGSLYFNIKSHGDVVNLNLITLTLNVNIKTTPRMTLQFYQPGSKIQRASESKHIGIYPCLQPLGGFIDTEQELDDSILVKKWHTSFEFKTHSATLRETGIVVTFYDGNEKLGACEIDTSLINPGNTTSMTIPLVCKRTSWSEVARKLSLNTGNPFKKSNEMRRSGRCAKLLSLRSSFVLLYAILLAIVISILTAMLWNAAINELEDSSNLIVANSADRVLAEYNFFFSGPLMTATTLANLPALQTATDLDNLAYLFRDAILMNGYNLRMVQAYIAYYGSEDDKFVFVREEGNATTDTVSFVRDGTTGTRNFHTLNRSCGFRTYSSCNLWDSASAHLPDATFVPSDRPWFIDGKNTESTRYSEPYAFASSGLPGVTAYAQVKRLSPTSQFGGVVGVDFTLQFISTFMEGLSYYKTGVGFMVNMFDGKMIANSVGDSNLIDPSHSTNFLIRLGARMAEDQCSSNGNVTAKWICMEQVSANVWTSDGVSLTVRTGGLNYTKGGVAIVIVIPEEDYTDSYKENALVAIYTSIGLYAFSILVSYIVIHYITRDLVRATKLLKRYAELDFRHEFPEHGLNSWVKEIARVYMALFNMKTALKSFSKYVPIEIIRYLIRERKEAVLGGERKYVTVFFSDIVNFTNISECLELDKLITLMGAYLQEMTAIIEEHQGCIDKYVGDAIMALWNVPENMDNYAEKACMAALKCRDKLNSFSKGWVARGFPVVRARIGLHTGEAIVGNFGAKERLNYTALGDTINLGSRLEALNKEYGTSIMISEATYEMVKGEFICRPLDFVAVKGKDLPCLVFELVAAKARCSVELVEDIELFVNAFNDYRQQNFEEALSKFESYLSLHEADVTCKIHIQSCKFFLQNPPQKDWNGVRVMKTK